MNVRKKPKQSQVGILLVAALKREGDLIFTTDRARELAPCVGLKDSYVIESLFHLRQNKWIVSLRRGLYALSSTVTGGAVAHEFEIAMAIVEPAAISHWSALHYHGLTQQIPRDVFVMTTKGTSVPKLRGGIQGENGGGIPIGDTTYRFVQKKSDRFFGVEKAWVGDAHVSVTDLERTLLDGLSMPRHCGDFAEVIHAFQVSMNRLDIKHISEYAARLDVTTAKRLGWVLETQGVTSPELNKLAALPIKGYRNLNPTGPQRGQWNKRWMVRENWPEGGRRETPPHPSSGSV